MTHLIRLLNRRATLLAALLLVSGVVKASAPAFVPTDAFEITGFQPTRGYFSVQPFDRVDLVNGGLSFSFTDLVLPGNAGMDLVLKRTYTHGTSGQKWNFSFTSAPIMIKTPEECAPPRDGRRFRKANDGCGRLELLDDGRFLVLQQKYAEALPAQWVGGYVSDRWHGRGHAGLP